MDSKEFLSLYLDLDEAHKTAIGELIIACAKTQDIDEALESVTDSTIREEYRRLLAERGEDNK